MEAKNIHKSMAAIIRSVDHIGKSQKNAQQGFTYRGIDDLYNSLHAAFAEQGVIIYPEVLETKREERTSSKGGLLLWTIQKIKFKFTAEDGSYTEAILNGEAMDSADKGCNKANSAALKYALLQMFLIPTEELKQQDTDASTPEPKSKYQAEKDDCLRLIAQADKVEDLSILKETFPEHFNKDSDVKKAGMEKFNLLNTAGK